MNDEHGAGKARGALFKTTHWSLVLAACDSQAPGSRLALAELCRIYWYPLYAHVRRHGYDADNAQDLTQGFFEHLLEHKSLRHVDSRKGKFRSFLLGSLQKFLMTAQRQDCTIKRGGLCRFISLDKATESRYQLEPADDSGLNAEKIFDARWALALLNELMKRLQESYADEGQKFDVLKVFLLPTGPAPSYENAAVKLGLSVPAVKTSIHRLRQEYKALLRREVARTVSDPAEVDEEIRYLCEVVVAAGGQI
ncbi:MAG: sigma-70 family RNA polymerase sigma factor [Chthoniobacterales bacterium]